MTQDPTAQPDGTVGPAFDPPPATEPIPPHPTYPGPPAGPPADPAGWPPSGPAAASPEATPPASWPPSAPTGGPQPVAPGPETGWTPSVQPPAQPQANASPTDPAWAAGPPPAPADWPPSAPSLPSAPTGWPPAQGDPNAAPTGWLPAPGDSTAATASWPPAQSDPNAPTGWPPHQPTGPDAAPTGWTTPEQSWPPADPNAPTGWESTPGASSAAPAGWPPAQGDPNAAPTGWQPAQGDPNAAGWPPAQGGPGAPTGWQPAPSDPNAATGWHQGAPNTAPPGWPPADPNQAGGAWAQAGPPATGPQTAPPGWGPNAPVGPAQTGAKPKGIQLKKPAKIAALATAAVVVLAGVGLGGAALAGVGPLAGPRSGPDLSPMEQAYIDLAVDLDPAVRVQLDYTQDVDALVILGLETATQPHLNELGSAVKQALDGQDAFIFLYDPTVELIEALAGLQTSSLKLAVTRGVDPSELISAFVRSNVTALMLEELLLPSGTSTFDSVTHLSFFNPTLRGLELATSLFPNLTSLSVGCEDDKVEYWRATSLERTSHLTNLNVGAGHGLWYDPAWLPEETTVDAESLALWLVDHPYTIKAFNGQPLVGFKLTVSQSDLHSYRAWSLREFTSEILSDEAPAYQPGPGEFGLSGGLAVTLKSPPSGWSDSHQAAASGQEYHGLPADRLAQVPEDLRFIAQITLRAGPQEGNNIYRNSAGEITGLALYGLTSVQVFDLTDHIAYAAVDTGSSPAPDRVYSNGDHHGPMLPQTAVDRLIASLI